MLMRFRGGGVGHRSTRAATNIFTQDCDDLDKTRDFSSAAGDEEQEDTADDGLELEEMDAAEGEVLEMEEYGYDGVEQVEDESESVADIAEDIDGLALEGDEPELGPEDGEDDEFAQDEVCDDYGEL